MRHACAHVQADICHEYFIQTESTTNFWRSRSLQKSGLQSRIQPGVLTYQVDNPGFLVLGEDRKGFFHPSLINGLSEDWSVGHYQLESNLTSPEEHSCRSCSDRRSEASLTFYYPVECSAGTGEEKKTGQADNKVSLGSLRGRQGGGCWWKRLKRGRGMEWNEKRRSRCWRTHEWGGGGSQRYRGQDVRRCSLNKVDESQASVF